MGCGGSKESLDCNAVAQAMIDKEKEKESERQRQRQSQEKKLQPQEQPASMKKTTTAIAALSTDGTVAQHNIEPSRGFHSMTIYKPDFVVDAQTEKDRAPRLAKQASAANLVQEHGSPLGSPSIATLQTTMAGSMTNSNKKLGAHHLRNVFAKPLDQSQVASFQAPTFPKSDDDRKFLGLAMKKNFVFTNLSNRQLYTMLNAFEQVQYPTHTEIMQQGDEGDFFFVVRDGLLHFEMDGRQDLDTPTLAPGQSFGELALLYQSPCAASVWSDSECTLYRVDQTTFRYILQTQREQANQDKRVLLQGIPFLKDLDHTDVDRLADAMVPRRFEAGETLARKGEVADTFYIIQEGKIRVLDLDVGHTKYEDYDLGPGEHFGERALVKDEPRPANFQGKTKGLVLAIDKQRFDVWMGDFAQLIHKSQDKKRLAAIRLIQNTYLIEATLATLASRIIDQTYPAQTELIAEGAYAPAALYLVREGRVEFKRTDGRAYRVVEEGGYFGDDTLTADLSGLSHAPGVVSKFTIATLDQKTTVGILTLEECRRYMDTTMIGKGKRTDFTSIVDADIPLKSLKKHGLVGAGTFGQVWLVSKVAPDGTNRPYALKVQSKYELIRSKQTKGVVRERDIMSQLKSPFLIRLVQTYQDDIFIYMLLGLVQGGELYSLIHTDAHDGIREQDAQFYAAGILEGLSYMHRRQIVYRDLKPENILIAYGGYPVVVDLGFAKIVESKTYTLCGTPLYLAPEVILNQGHDKAADHWSLGILMFEMMAGYTPFYASGIDQITLYRFIVRGAFRYPKGCAISSDGQEIINRFLAGDSRKRLGSLAGGIDQIYNEPWFDDIDFAALRRKEVEAPWKPNIKDPLDKSKFDNWDHLKIKSKMDYPDLPQRAQIIFKDF